MNIKMFISILLNAGITLFLTFSINAVETAHPHIIPEPQSISIKDGYFTLSSKSTIRVSEQLAPLLQYLKTVLPIKQAAKNKIGDINLKTDASIADKYGKEAYKMSVTPKSIEIAGASPTGVFYGIQTLLQLLPPTIITEKIPKEGYTIPSMTIIDYPRFSWRGLLIDSGRHFVPVKELKKMLDAMALLKMNTLHWHLTEDQGWRIEIKKYPRLTQIASIRTESPQHGNRKKGDGTPYGPYFYTQKQIKEIVAYAKHKFINIVPEIEMPGHSVAALAAYPELGCTGGPYKVRTSWGIEPDIYCAGNEKTYTFLEDVLTEVMQLFPSKFIHIGGDEAPKTRWNKCPKCQAKIKKEGLKNSHELQSYFIMHFVKFLADHGRHLVGWDEILEGGLPKGAVVMSWRGERGGIKAAKMNHDVIMTPGGYCYLDHYESKKAGEPEAIGGLLPLSKVYSYNPIPSALRGESRKHILGLQGNLWSEYIWTPQDLEYKAFPRACAIAEVGWTIPENKNYNRFLSNLNFFLKRLKSKGINYRPLEPPPTIIGRWSPKTTPMNFTIVSFNITKYISSAGNINIVFKYEKGKEGVEINGCELMENNIVVASDTHKGFTGARNKKNRYKLKLKKYSPKATYTLKTTIKGSGGTDSNGFISIEANNINIHKKPLPSPQKSCKQPPDKPIDPHTFVANIGSGAWLITRSPLSQKKSRPAFSPQIPKILTSNGCPGGRVHIAISDVVDKKNMCLKPETLKYIHQIADDFLASGMYIVMMIEIIKGKNPTARDMELQYKIWDQISYEVRNKSHRLALSPFIEWHGWEKAPYKEKWQKFEDMQHKCTEIFRKYNPTRILAYKGMGSSRLNGPPWKFLHLEKGIANPYFILCGSASSLGTAHHSKKFLDWNINEQYSNEEIKKEIFDFFKPALDFREKYGTAIFVDHWTAPVQGDELSSENLEQKIAKLKNSRKGRSEKTLKKILRDKEKAEKKGKEFVLRKYKLSQSKAFISYVSKLIRKNAMGGAFMPHTIQIFWDKDKLTPIIPAENSPEYIAQQIIKSSWGKSDHVWKKGDKIFH